MQLRVSELLHEGGKKRPAKVIRGIHNLAFPCLTESLHWNVSDLKYRISPPTMADKTERSTEVGSRDSFCVAEEAT